MLRQSHFSLYDEAAEYGQPLSQPTEVIDAFRPVFLASRKALRISAAG